MSDLIPILAVASGLLAGWWLGAALWRRVRPPKRMSCMSLVCRLVVDRVPFALTFTEDGKYQIEDLTPVPEVGKYTDRFRQEKKMLAPVSEIVLK